MKIKIFFGTRFFAFIMMFVMPVSYFIAKDYYQFKKRKSVLFSIPISYENNRSKLYFLTANVYPLSNLKRRATWIYEVSTDNIEGVKILKKITFGGKVLDISCNTENLLYRIKITKDYYQNNIKSVYYITYDVKNKKYTSTYYDRDKITIKPLTFDTTFNNLEKLSKDINYFEWWRICNHLKLKSNTYEL